MKVSFKVDGEFVCQLARRWFWEENRPFEKSEELLLGVLVTPALTLDQRKEIAIQILEGRKKLVGIDSFSLVDDNENVCPLSDKFKEYERKAAIAAIKKDMEARPLAYIDVYAATKPLDEFEEIERWHKGENPFEGMPTPQDMAIRLYLFSYQNFVGESFLESEYYETEYPLDRGMYLLEKPALVYDLIGEVLTAFNETQFYEKLYEYWEQKLQNCKGEERNVKIKARNERYLATLRAPSPSAETEARTKPDKDILLRMTEPDDFLSEYGVIDKHGNWYSCSFGGHNAKAYNLIKDLPELAAFHTDARVHSFDKCLDILYDAGWVIFKNPYLGGSPKISFSVEKHPTRAQVNKVFDYMAHFNRATLGGIEKILFD